MLSSQSDGKPSGDSSAEDVPSTTVQARVSSAKPNSLRKLVRGAARDMEARIIMQALEQHHWNRRRTAEALNISYRSLMYKMKYCNLRDIDPPSRREAT
jgi:DNA-binding NtrC family response regulator